jgi:hypothetical protein
MNWWKNRPTIFSRESKVFLFSTLVCIFPILTIGIGFYIRNQQRMITMHARQTEARFRLAETLMALEAWQSKHGFQTTDFNALDVKMNKPLHYKFGFARPVTFGLETRLRNPAVSQNEELKDSDAVHAHYTDDAPDEPFDQLAQHFCPDCTVAPGHAKILAVGKNMDGSFDVWTLDEHRNMVHHTEARVE